MSLFSVGSYTVSLEYEYLMYKINAHNLKTGGEKAIA